MEYSLGGDSVACTLDSRLSGLGSSPGRGHCVLFLARYFTFIVPHSHTGVKIGTGEFNAVAGRDGGRGGE